MKLAAAIVTGFLAAVTASVARAEPTSAEVVAAARAEGLPVDVLEAKVREARLKRVPEGVAAAAVLRLRDNLRTADALVEIDRGDPGRQALVVAAAQALSAGATEAQVEVVLAAPGRVNERAQGLRTVAGLVASGLTGDEASELVGRVLRNGDAGRLGNLRASIEVLRAAGVEPRDAAGEVGRALASGRSPLDAAQDRARGSESKRTGNSGSSSNGAAPSPGGGASNTDRDRSDGPQGSRANGNNGKGNGKP